jgi:riboflavin kinase / FMN adenylyltransferase
MRIITHLESFPESEKDSLVLALGNFDGLHLGHQKLLNHVIQEARKGEARAGILTFQEHPQQVLHPDARPPLLTSVDHKLFLLEEFGIDFCFLLHFTENISRMEPRAFVREILMDRLHIREVCLGYNARFGRDRKGDTRLMKRLAEEFGFQFTEIGPVEVRGEVVSSSRIRRLIGAGRFGEARDCLGRPFSVVGKVVRGAGRGRQLGYPTANLEVEGEVLPPYGIYPVKVRVLTFRKITDPAGEILEFSGASPGSWLEGVLSYGFRPTFEKDAIQAVAEVLVMDFEGDLVGKTLEVIFYPRLREEIVFKNPESLKEQIAKDVVEAKKVLSGFSKNTFTKFSG